MKVTITENTMVLRKITGTMQWKVENRYKFSVNGKNYYVPKGQTTDLSSTPRILWPIFPKSGKYTEAGVVHDYLYRNGVLPRKESDEVYREICKICGVGSIRRGLMHKALRIFGGPNYKG